MLEQKKQTHYNFVFMFLALYGKICFIAFILCRLKVDLLGNTYNYCKEDIFLYNIHIDAVYINCICRPLLFLFVCWESTKEPNSRNQSQKSKM